MSKPVNTGGPAFPQQPSFNTPHGTIKVNVENGMTLRDWFAGKAMQALASDMAGVVATADDHGVNPTVLMARLSYGVADAMLAAREPSNAEKIDG